eukprot:CAMPEP_0198203900 /NCGR_PEP_ID=MMETSP1445-20131203/7233_1 /TAXON_ID=36898 /ORGANISM="Pyramimonas sp., Strain CCMP2087" /LENGTH=669 /DNA_ID=CAMNT_0043875485 /DNA_START=77 /DNA_END=2086 /DNA_ORIENTATION=-
MSEEAALPISDGHSWNRTSDSSHFVSNFNVNSNFTLSQQERMKRRSALSNYSSVPSKAANPPPEPVTPPIQTEPKPNHAPPRQRRSSEEHGDAPKKTPPKNPKLGFRQYQERVLPLKSQPQIPNNSNPKPSPPMKISISKPNPKNDVAIGSAPSVNLFLGHLESMTTKDAKHNDTHNLHLGGNRESVKGVVNDPSSDDDAQVNVKLGDREAGGPLLSQYNPLLRIRQTTPRGSHFTHTPRGSFLSQLTPHGSQTTPDGPQFALGNPLLENRSLTENPDPSDSLLESSTSPRRPEWRSKIRQIAGIQDRNEPVPISRTSSEIPGIGGRPEWRTKARHDRNVSEHESLSRSGSETVGSGGGGRFDGCKPLGASGGNVNAGASIKALIWQPSAYTNVMNEMLRREGFEQEVMTEAEEKALRVDKSGEEHRVLYWKRSVRLAKDLPPDILQNIIKEGIDDARVKIDFAHITGENGDAMSTDLGQTQRLQSLSFLKTAPVETAELQKTNFNRQRQWKAVGSKSPQITPRPPPKSKKTPRSDARTKYGAWYMDPEDWSAEFNKGPRPPTWQDRLITSDPSGDKNAEVAADHQPVPLLLTENSTKKIADLDLLSERQIKLKRQLQGSYIALVYKEFVESQNATSEFERSLPHYLIRDEAPLRQRNLSKRNSLNSKG